MPKPSAAAYYRRNAARTAAAVALNPEYHQGGRFVPGTLASAVYELRKRRAVARKFMHN